MPGSKKVSNKPDDYKLRELVVLITTLSEGDQAFGKVKLSKLLFFADFIAYRKFGKSITGHEYQKLPQGPVPRRLLSVVPALASPGRSGGGVVVRKELFFGKNMQRPLALRSPEISKFKFEELELVRELVTRWKGKTAREISERSHEFVGWQKAELKETIPYAVALVGSRPPSALERKRGLELEKLARKKLCLA